MKIDEITISDEALQALLKRGEGQFFDFKQSDISPAKLSRTLSAFANSDGGEVVVGITDPDPEATWQGLSNVEDANPIMQVINETFAAGNGIRASFVSHPAKIGLILSIEVEKSAHLVKATNGKYYIRRGAQSLAVSSDEVINQIKINKGIISHEDVIICDDAIPVIESDSINNFMNYTVPNNDPESWLKKQRLIINDKVTVCGVVLFSDEPQIYIPKAAVKIYRYATSENEGSRASLVDEPLAVEGNAYHQIYGAVNKVAEIAGSVPVVSQSGMEKVSYPRVAIHEIITNAVIHRDYSKNDDVHVRIFDNRIEVESPGTLPGHITPQNILSDRFARNPKTVRLLNKHQNPPNKDVGEGLNTTFQAMRDLKLREPLIIAREQSVLVILRHERLGSSEEIIINHLRENESINNTKARELCAIGDANKMKRVFQVMQRADLIERIPNLAQSKAAYRRGKKFPY